ncbi:MAG TPA: helix-turn-helix transcriptional regulator [Allosphingosinicella sp.]|nr:helix-turn-helix transcriptional regulator [Allosphingosinicella sp.]
MSKVKDGLVKWQPELSSEAFEHIARLRAEIEPRIRLMRELRTVLGLTQVEVAKLLGVTQSNVSKIEAGGDPSLSVLARMADAKGMRLRLAVEAPDGKEAASFSLG